MVYPILSAILAIFAFNSSWNFFILVALAPFFWFLTQEQKFWKLIAGTAVFRLIFSLGTVYFVIDPFLYFLSILIFLGLPVSFYLIRRYWSSEIAVWSLPILWTVWDYLEAQYTFLPMTIMMLGNSLAESPFLGLAKFDGIIGLDVQPLPTDRNDQQAASIERSIRNFRRALECTDRIDLDELYELRIANDQAGIAELFTRAICGLD